MATLDLLGPVLESHGFFRHYLAFGDGNLRTWDWKLFGSKLDAPSRLLWRFFLCGARVPREKLDSLCPAGVIDRLVDLGLARATNGSVGLGKTVLIQCLGRPMFVDMNQPSRSRVGDDVIAVLNQSRSGTGRDILCLHSVGGTEALAFAEAGERRVTVVGEDHGSGFIRANWELNHGEDILQILTSIEDLSPGTEDLILARVPSLPIPPEYEATEIEEAGGRDGASRLREVFSLAARRLNADGHLGFVCMVPGGEEASVAVARMRRIADEAGLVLEAEILSRQRLEPGVSVFNQIIFLAEKKTQRNVRTLIDDFMGYCQQQGFQFVYFVKGLARNGSNGRKARHRITEFTDRYFGTWTV
jgi:hypothetical protein